MTAATEAQINFIKSLQEQREKGRDHWLKYSTPEELVENDPKIQGTISIIFSLAETLADGLTLKRRDYPRIRKTHAEAIETATAMMKDGKADSDIEAAISSMVLMAEANYVLNQRMKVYAAVDTPLEGLSKEEASKLIEVLKTDLV